MYKYGFFHKFEKVMSKIRIILVKLFFFLHFCTGKIFKIFLRIFQKRCSCLCWGNQRTEIKISSKFRETCEKIVPYPFVHPSCVHPSVRHYELAGTTVVERLYTGKDQYFSERLKYCILITKGFWELMVSKWDCYIYFLWS